MDKEILLQQFEEIEHKVDRMIDLCNRYERANSELKEKIRILEEELQSKVETENRHNAEKEIIRSKIDNLLGKLADISPAQEAPSTDETDLEG